MASMCEECKCSTYYNEEIDMYSCENECPCCNDPDYKSSDDILAEIIAYLNLHKISLEQDSIKIEKAMDEYENYEDDAYRELEIEDISNNGQIIATNHILKYIMDLTNPLRTE